MTRMTTRAVIDAVLEQAIARESTSPEPARTVAMRRETGEAVLREHALPEHEQRLQRLLAADDPTLTLFDLSLVVDDTLPYGEVVVR